jgi:hypothetical protein
MKRLLTAAALLLVGLPVGVTAQSDAQRIERAVLGAPARMQDAVMVVKWNADHSHTVIREGSNGMVCYDRSGEPGQRPFSVQCTSEGNLARISQNRRFAAEAEDRRAVGALVAAAAENGTREPAVYGSVWIRLTGDTAESAGRHLTIAMPMATEASSGFPESGQGGGAYLMAAGTTEAHLMTPGR